MQNIIQSRRYIFAFMIGLLLAASLRSWADDTNSYTTVIVQFPMDKKTTHADAKALFEASAPNYRNLPGLIRKYYLFSDAGIGGGVYLWQHRAAAEALYTEEWKKSIEQRLGAAPSVTYFETPVIVDNTQK